MSQTLITSRDPKGLHAVGLFEAAYNKSRLDEARAQRLNERGGELQDGIVKLIAELSVSNQFADEKVRSSYTYPKEYKGPKPVADQIKTLAKIFGLDPSHEPRHRVRQELACTPRGRRGMVRHSVGRRAGQEALSRSDRSGSEVLPGGSSSFTSRSRPPGRSATTVTTVRDRSRRRSCGFTLARRTRWISSPKRRRATS
ncbi:MAG: hypothetical protein UU38_C0003G0172 [Candidatus Wolfebacteria bacterium GW2011_GWB1_41_12]|uniref:Uncharacterized protein n=1 Tax=Candidatus Wolfebacteria bacterium GW2011_GWB1_41_12 TaxID=1619006 RepID=A0A0G0WWU2_9BACT|nr:MAG: hypothetical protein UU38_C0003G0172 [Candidatus Wolfebacteria bacterium GW2011_GWB1_41_12]